MTPSPRNYTAAAPEGLRLPGLPHERLARIAARRTFVEMKQVFLRAAASLDEDRPHTAWLRRQVRHAQQPEDLWLLRSAMFDALRGDTESGPRTRYELRKCLDSVFPGTSYTSFFSAF